MNIRLKKILGTPWFALTVTAMTALLIYSNTYQCPFVFDDLHSIAENLKIRDLTNFFERHGLLHSRIIVDLSFALNYHFGRLDVFGYHLVNILIHIANGFMVYFLSMTILEQIGLTAEDGKIEIRGQGAEGVRRKVSSAKFQAPSFKRQVSSAKPKVQGKKKKGKKNAGIVNLKQSSPPDSKFKIQNSKFPVPLVSLFAALIFIAHPIQTQAVTYIVQRYASVAAFFYMASVLFYLKARVNGESLKLKAENSRLKVQSSENQPSTFGLLPVTFYLLSFTCGILAFMSKQNAASLPGAILLVEYVCFRGKWKQWLRRILWIAPAAVLFILFVLHNMGAFNGADIGQMLEDVSGIARETRDVNRWEYLCTQFNVLVVYIRLLLLPVNQNLDYCYQFKTGFFDDFTPLAFGFLAGLALLAVWRRKRCPIFFLAIFWFFITLSVESSLIPIRDALFEHRLYLPMFGFALLFAWLTFRLLSKKRVAAVFICTVMAGTLGSATYLRNRVWQDPVTLWSDVAAKVPLSVRARVNLGQACIEEGRYDEAIACNRRVLQFDSNNVKANYNMALALQKMGKIEDAVDYYRKTLRLDARYARAHYNLGNLFQNRGDLTRAVDHYNQVLRITPKDVKTLNNLAGVLVKQGEVQKALDRMQAAVREDPADTVSRNNLGGIFEVRSNWREAARCYAETLRRDPENQKAHERLGRILPKMGELEGALRHLWAVLRIQPDQSDILNDIGVVLEMQKNLKSAAGIYCKALYKKPGYQIARKNLDRVLARLAEPAVTAECYRKIIDADPNVPAYRIQMGIALSRMGQWGQAIEQFQAAVGLSPLDPVARYNLGLAFAQQGKLKKAAAEYQVSLNLREKSAKVHFNLALVFSHLENFSAAIDHFEAALALEPALKKRAASEIARCWQRLGNEERSRKWRQKAAADGVETPPSAG